MEHFDGLHKYTWFESVCANGVHPPRWYARDFFSFPCVFCFLLSSLFFFAFFFGVVSFFAFSFFLFSVFFSIFSSLFPCFFLLFSSFFAFVLFCFFFWFVRVLFSCCFSRPFFLLFSLHFLSCCFFSLSFFSCFFHHFFAFFFAFLLLRISFVVESQISLQTLISFFCGFVDPSELTVPIPQGKNVSLIRLSRPMRFAMRLGTWGAAVVNPNFWPMEKSGIEDLTVETPKNPDRNYWDQVIIHRFESTFFFLFFRCCFFSFFFLGPFFLFFFKISSFLFC